VSRIYTIPKKRDFGIPRYGDTIKLSRELVQVLRGKFTRLKKLNHC